MNTTLPRAITKDEINSYDQDGAVFMPGIFDQEWVELIRQGLVENQENPSPRSRIYDRDAEGHTFFYDSQSWLKNDAYRKFAFDSPCAELAGTLMNVSKVNFFFDAVFIRSQGTKTRTPWHQDEPYWSVNGFDTCSIWMPMVPVEKKSALEFVKGSHRLPNKFRQENFGDMNPDGEENVATVDFADQNVEPFPDVEGNRDQYDILSWDMEPGDCVVFNSRMIHGGSGNLADDRDLKVFNTQWLGDDVRASFHSYGMDPDHSAIMKEMGINDGDPLGSPDTYPVIWERA